MNRFIVFCVGAAASVVSEVFWKGNSRWPTALWGGAGMLLLRRIVLRFSFASRALLCLLGALLMFVLRIAIILLIELYNRSDKSGWHPIQWEIPSFSYGLYRFLLLAPAYTIIEYLETCFRM